MNFYEIEVDTTHTAPLINYDEWVKDYPVKEQGFYLADGETVRWLDFNQKFFNAEGQLTREVMNDLLHPNEKGYQIWLDAILPTFKEICGK